MVNKPRMIAATQVDVQISGRQLATPLEKRIRQAIEVACARFAVSSATFSLRIVDDAEIHQVNRQYLAHDYPTDVISFPYERTDDHVEGELVVSWETARRVAGRVGWEVDHELLLYVIHGVLHCLGMEDAEPADRAAMRQRERDVLGAVDIPMPPRGPDEEGGETC